MLPGPLVGIYQQYKEDTNAVASWLASTAKLCGCPANLLSTVGASAPDGGGSKRLKGKARKEAKAKQAASQQPGSQSQPQRPAGKSGPKYTIAIKNFVPLAEFVAASSQPLVSVPRAFTATLDRVITTRASFGDRLAEHGTVPSRESGQKHSYFVRVLQKVQEILKPRTPPTSTSTSTTAQAQDAASPASAGVGGLGGLGGQFASLTVYEPSEDFLNAPDIPRPAPVQNDDSATYEAEPLMDLEETLFAYALMIDDLIKIRAKVGWIWANLAGGAFDLAAAAVATNTACDLARNLMEDMCPMFKAHGGAINIAQKFYLMQCVANGFSVHLNPPDGDFNYATYDIANDTYMIPFIMLETFLENVLHPSHVPLYKEGTFGAYDPSRDWQTMSNRHKFTQDKILMLEYLPELITAAHCVPEYPVRDEFLRGMGELDKTREIPMYLAFAAQLFLDAHHILREKVLFGLDTCMWHMQLMHEDLDQHLEFHENLRINSWPASNDDVLRELQRRLMSIRGDPVFKAKVLAFRGKGVSAMSAHRILKYSPVLSGLLLYHFRAQLYNFSIAVVNAWGSIVYPFHLYMALAQGHLDEEVWEDMDLLFGMLDTSIFFVGDEVPKTIDDAFKKFCLQMGTTASVYSKSKHKRIQNPENLISKSGPRGIKDGVPVSSMFMDRYVQNTGQVDWTPEHIDNIVSRSLYEEEDSQGDGMFRYGQIEDPEKLREKKKQNRTRNAGGKKTADGARLSPDQLVRSLTLALAAESLEMAFPYLTLHRSAWGFLRAVRDACDPLLRQIYSPAYMERESQLPWVIGWIFMATVEGDTRLLPKAAGAVKACIKAGDGAKAIQRFSAMRFDVQTVYTQDSA